jgi:hypothetical protein
MAHDKGLAGERIGGEGGKEEGDFNHIFNVCEFMIDGAAQHDALHHFVFRDAEGFRLFRNLFLNERCFNKAGADDVGADAMLGTFLGNHFGKPNESVLCGNIS